MKFKLLLLLIIITTILSIKTQRKCRKDSECQAQYSCFRQKCILMTLFPMNYKKILGSVILFIVVSLSAACGMGGGSITVPIVLGLFEYDIRTSIMVSYLIICGGALGSFCKTCRVKNEITGFPLVLYDLILISLPMLIIGSYYGVFLNKIFPTFLISFFLVIVCLQSLYKTIKVTKTQMINDNFAERKGNFFNLQEGLVFKLKLFIK